MNIRHAIITGRGAAIIRGAAWTGLALLIWTFSSKFVQELVVYAAGIYALIRLCRGHPGIAAWKQPAGITFLALAAHLILSLPFSDSPAYSWQDFTGLLKIAAGAAAIPVVFHQRRHMEAALFYSANAITLTLAYDLGRLYHHLGGDMLQQAHFFQPFILNHSNVASMMAGMAALVYFYFLMQKPLSIRRAAGYGAGILTCLAYMWVAASRGPQAAMALTLICIGMLFPARRAKLLWIGVLTGAVLLAVLNMEIVNPRFTERETVTNLSQRDRVWRHTWQLIGERPWTGYGYGKRNFTAVYYRSDPPPADFYFPHPHHFWLKLLFAFGWPGALLHLAAWLILGAQLSRCIRHAGTFRERLWPGCIGMMLLFVHVYGLGDYPDNVVRTAQIWLIPVALSVMANLPIAKYRFTSAGGKSQPRPTPDCVPAAI